jgi:hypothetical protein
VSRDAVKSKYWPIGPDFSVSLTTSDRFRTALALSAARRFSEPMSLFVYFPFYFP